MFHLYNPLTTSGGLITIPNSVRMWNPIPFRSSACTVHAPSSRYLKRSSHFDSTASPVSRHQWTWRRHVWWCPTWSPMSAAAGVPVADSLGSEWWSAPKKHLLFVNYQQCGLVSHARHFYKVAPPHSCKNSCLWHQVAQGLLPPQPWVQVSSSLPPLAQISKTKYILESSCLPWRIGLGKVAAAGEYLAWTGLPWPLPRRRWALNPANPRGFHRWRTPPSQRWRCS